MFRIDFKGKWLLLAGLLYVAPGMFAQCAPGSSTPTIAGTACMDLISGGNLVFNNFAYVGPYTARINGGTPTNVICDDFFDDSFVPETWTADIYSGSGPFSTTRMAQLSQFNAATIPTITQAYDTVGYLALQLLSASDVTTAAEIHFALWNVFDPGVLDAYLPGNTVASGYFTDAVKKAAGDAAGTTYISQFTIYTPNMGQTYYVDGKPYVRPPQEFLVQTPEPSFLALLGADLSGVGALFFLMRRRRSARP